MLHQRRAYPATDERGEAFDPLHVRDRPRFPLRQRQERLVRDDPERREVRLARPLVPRAVELTQNGRLPWREIPRSLDGPERLGVEGARFPGAARHEAELLLRPCKPPLLLKLAAQQVPEADQMAHVLRGVDPLAIGERAARPIVALTALVELHAEMDLDESGQADDRPAEELRRDHRIEERGHLEAVVAPQIQHVLLRRVQHLDDGGLSEDLPERIEPSHRQRIDQVCDVTVRDLEQAALVKVMVEGVGFGVDGQRPRAPQARHRLRQTLLRVDPDVGRSVGQDSATSREAVRSPARWRRIQRTTPARIAAPTNRSYFRKDASSDGHCSPSSWPSQASP